MVVCDYFTKLVEAYPLFEYSAYVVDAPVTLFIYQYGMPYEIHTDQGADFESKLLKEVCKLLEMDKTRTYILLAMQSQKIMPRLG